MKTSELKPVLNPGPTHRYRREDAIWHNGREYVPTTQKTKYVSTLKEFTEAGGITHFNEDQTEITLTVPEGAKFSIRFMDEVV